MMIYIATKGFINVNIIKNYKKETAEITYSEIIDTSEYRGDENSSWQRQIRYIYFVDGKQFEGEDIIWWRFFLGSDINMQIGDKIDIYYNIDDPSQSEVYHISYVLIFLGICIIILTSLILKQRIKEKQEY